jgi:hypothetical protein
MTAVVVVTHVAHVVTPVQVQQLVTNQPCAHLAVSLVLLQKVPTMPQELLLLLPQVLMHRKLPLSALLVKQPHLPLHLQRLTVKENNYVATRSPEIPQRAKRP